MAWNECSQDFPGMKPEPTNALSDWAFSWRIEDKTCNNIAEEWNKLLSDFWQPVLPNYWWKRISGNQYSQMVSALEGVINSGTIDPATKEKAAKIASTLRKKIHAK